MFKTYARKTALVIHDVNQKIINSQNFLIKNFVFVTSNRLNCFYSNILFLRQLINAAVLDKFQLKTALSPETSKIAPELHFHWFPETIKLAVQKAKTEKQKDCADMF